MDGAEVLPAPVLGEDRALLGSVGGGYELVGYLGEVVEFGVLSFGRGDLGVVELGEGGELGDGVEGGGGMGG